MKVEIVNNILGLKPGQLWKRDGKIYLATKNVSSSSSAGITLVLVTSPGAFASSWAYDRGFGANHDVSDFEYVGELKITL